MTLATSSSEQFITVHNASIYVKTWTPQNVLDSVPIILLHDSLGCTEMWRDFPQAFVEDRTREGISKAQIDFADVTMFSRLKKYHGEKTPWVLDAWIKVWLSSEFSQWSLRSDLPKVHCPVMAIHGDSDEYGSVKFPEMISSLAAGHTEMQIIPSCGHVPHREKPEVILNLCARFYVS